MDSTDYKILDLLQDNSRITYTQISGKINLSIPSVKEIIESMTSIITSANFRCKFMKDGDIK